MPDRIGRDVGCECVVCNASPPLARRASRLASPRQLSYLVCSRAAWGSRFAESPCVVLNRSSRFARGWEGQVAVGSVYRMSWPGGPVGLGDSNGGSGLAFSWTTQGLSIFGALVPHYLAVSVARPEVDFRE